MKRSPYQALLQEGCGKLSGLDGGALIGRPNLRESAVKGRRVTMNRRSPLFKERGLSSLVPHPGYRSMGVKGPPDAVAGQSLSNHR